MKTNALKHIISVNSKKVNCCIAIRLDDECKNGHQDFAITGTFWEVGKVRTDRNMLTAGCCHETILTYFPDLKPFVALHRCDYLGIPMYATANGFYHLTNGFNDKTRDLKEQFCKYYRITPEQFEALKLCENQLQYATTLISLNVRDQWKKEADAAIKLLETMTSCEFVVDSVKDQFGMLTDEQLAEELARQQSGYYSAEKKAERTESARRGIIDELNEKRAEKIATINLETDVSLAVFAAGGKRALDNMIFYAHNNTIKFNWRGFGDSLTDAEIQHVKDTCVLPNNGIKYLND